MNEDPKQNSIQQAVLDKIRSGAIRKRPRLYFTLRIIATLVVATLLLIISSLIVSFILFSLHEGGEQFLLGFGLQGILVFFLLFPWWYLLIDILLLVALEWLLRGFKLGYRVSLLTIFVVVFGVSLIGGILIDKTPLHRSLFQHAEQERVPVFGNPYQHVLDPHEDRGIFRGIITAIGTSTISMKHDDPDHDQDAFDYTVLSPAGFPLDSIHVGDRILVFGHSTPAGIETQNITVLPPLPSMDE